MRPESQPTALFPEEELAALIRSLDRAADNHLFAEDVPRTYPHLAESYVKVCPKRMDLRTAAEKALAGHYSSEPKLSSLKEDVALMARNCIRFNGADSPFATIAETFEGYAMQQIDAYLERRTGGRRASLARLVAQSTTTNAVVNSSSTTATAAAARRGGARREEETASVAPAIMPTNEQLSTLISSLARREDGGAFTVDVGEAFPDLRESYDAMCPNKMNLVLMKTRAESGFYAEEGSTEQPTLLANTVAGSFPRLRADIELIVANCQRFNAKTEAWVQLARGFQRFAHRKVDDLVLRLAPALRGTKMGSEAFVSRGTPAATAGAESAAGQKRPRDDDAPPHTEGNGRGRTSNTSAAQREPPGSMALRHIVATVRPTPLQPQLNIPANLRQRLVQDHLRRDALHARLVGVELNQSDIYVMPPPPPPPPPTEVVKHDDEGHGSTSDTAPTTSVATSSPEAAATAEPSPSVVVCVGTSTTAAALASAFADSVHAHFEMQRHRTDFDSPFCYTAQEEAFYRTSIGIILREFNRLLTNLLLYEREAAELKAWSAARAVSGLAKEGTTIEKQQQQQQELSATSATCMENELDDWAGVAHYSYLVRLLVQWPQLVALCCATKTSARGGEAAGDSRSSSVAITHDTLAMVEQLTKVTQEFLNFVSNFEAKLVDGLAHAP